MAALCGNMLTVSLLLRLFCLSGAQSQCDKDPVLFITAPKHLEALSGSCLQIPCSFREKSGENQFDSSREPFGVWIKSDSVFKNNLNNVIFNSSKTQNSYNIKMIGDLKQKKCTSVFNDVIKGHADKYFFRIETRLFMATASCDPVNITVRDSAWSPRLKMSADLQKKNSVIITCSALTPCPLSPPELSWDHQADSQRQMEENTDGSFTSKIQQSISLSDTHDGYNISCSATYPVKDTPASVSAGSWFYLSCSSRAKYPISNYTWFNISQHGVMEAAEGLMYIFSFPEGEVYYCENTPKIKEESSHQLLISLMSVIVVFVLFGLAFCVWFFRLKRSSPQPTQHVLPQSQTGQDLVLQSAANNPEEDVHYGDVNFLKKKPGASSVSVCNSRQQQEETVYSQVKLSQVENSSTQMAGKSEDLYAQVKEH